MTKYVDGFDRKGFELYLKENYLKPNDNFSMDLCKNLVEWGVLNFYTKDELAYFLSDIIPFFEFIEAAMFCSPSILTKGTIKQLEELDNNICPVCGGELISSPLYEEERCCVDCERKFFTETEEDQNDK